MIKYLLLFVGVSSFGQASLPSVRSVDTIADLVSMRTTGYTDNNKLVVEVLGYHSPNDGGGGRFAFTNSASSTNLGTIFTSTRSGYQWHRLNWDGDVRAFGVKADGITDDTLSLQTAVNFAKGTNFGPWFMTRPLNLSGRVQLPSGVIRASQLRLVDGVTLHGNANGSMIKQTDGANVPLVVSSNVVGWTIRDVVFDGNRDANTNANIFEMTGSLYGLLGTHMSRCILQNGSSNGFYIAVGGSGAVWDDIIVQNCYGRGFDIFSMSDAKLTKLDVRLCRQGGFRQKFGGNCVVSDSKFWANRIEDDLITTTKVIPISGTDVSLDEAAVEVNGSGHMWSNVDVQENGSIGMRIGSPQFQCSDSQFRNMVWDMNGGIDLTTPASYETNVLYRRDGLQMVNYYNVAVHGVAKDSRANQGKGRQQRGIAFVGTIPTFTSNTVANATGFLYTDEWYRITDISGGAIFTNIQWSLTNKVNTVGSVFQAQTYDYSQPIPQSWGTSGTLQAANDLADIDVLIVNQTQQNEGTGLGYAITTAGPLSTFKIRTPSQVVYKMPGHSWDSSGNYTNYAAAPVWTIETGNGTSGLRLNVLTTNAANTALFRVQNAGVNALFVNEDNPALTNNSTLQLLLGSSVKQILTMTNDSAGTGFRALRVPNNP